MVFFSVLWVLLLIGFLSWWFDPQHVGTGVGLILNTAVIIPFLVLPAAFVLSLRRLNRVDPDTPLPNLRVAIAVTKAPSEPWSEVRPTLEAALKQQIELEYDVWLCDEQPSAQTRDWCLANGVHISSREGVEEYHRQDWPRRTRCKEGNLAYFYDHVGYANYDVVAQFDCDHIPDPGYLRAMVQPFSDTAVGYVAAPSICDRNRGESWSGRGRLFAEAVFHGPFQLSHNGGLSPASIGSHYAVRTEYLRLAGGVGPELAEDFSTSYVIRLTGADGVFAIDAIAHGLGPTTYAAMVTQEFQWTRSLVVLLFGLVRRTRRNFRISLQFRYLWSLMFNPMFGLLTAAGFLLAPAAVVFDQEWMSLNFLLFLLFFGAVSLPLVGIMWVLRRERLLRPVDAPLLSWESGMYQIVRWPYLVQGAFAGVVQLLFNRSVNFRVTPKGGGGIEPIGMKVMLPHHLLAVSLTLVGVWGVVSNRSLGYAGLTLLGAVTYGAVALLIPWLHFRELPRAAGSRPVRLRAVIWPLLSGVVLFAVTLFAMFLFGITFFGEVRWRYW